MKRKEYISKYDHSVHYFRDPEKTIRHRERGLPSVKSFDVDKEYWENNKCHRLNGLACDYSSIKYHYLNGKQLFVKQK